MIDQSKLNEIARFLNLEKMLIRNKLELYCTPNSNDEEFKKRVEIIRKEIGNEAELKIIEEGEIDDDRNKLCSESVTDGVI